jgi:TfdA family taurine catabolism dioxygenase TauD
MFWQGEQMTALSEFTEAHVLYGVSAPYGFAEAMRGEAMDRAIITFADPTAHRRNLDLAASVLSTLGALLSIYPADGCWSDLTVRLDADPIRTHGTGQNPLHIDLVDRSNPPRYIALYCERDDPQGGGATALSDLWAVYGQLSADDRAVLSKPAFHYWTDKDVHGVGEPLSQFPLLPVELQPGIPIRFTTKMLVHLKRGKLVEAGIAQAAATAFERMVKLADANTVKYRLRPGQMIVFDQLRYAHGRLPLGADQRALPEHTRRLLKQAYVSGRVLT